MDFCSNTKLVVLYFVRVSGNKLRAMCYLFVNQKVKQSHLYAMCVLNQKVLAKKKGEEKMEKISSTPKKICYPDPNLPSNLEYLLPPCWGQATSQVKKP